MLAKDVRAGKKSCLSKAADDEPVFILRAHDVTAPLAVEAWADIVEAGLSAAIWFRLRGAGQDQASPRLGPSDARLAGDQRIKVPGLIGYALKSERIRICQK